MRSRRAQRVYYTTNLEYETEIEGGGVRLSLFVAREVGGSGEHFLLWYFTVKRLGWGRGGGGGAVGRLRGEEAEVSTFT